MKLRSLAAAAGVGAAAVGNRMLGRAGGHLDPALPGDQYDFRWRGMDVAYAALGDPDDPPLVLLHGPGVVGTSREFIAIADELAIDYRVLAPDLPGYGRSHRPPLTYSASLYEAFVGDFLEEVPSEAPTVVASGLSGSYAALAAPTSEVDRLALVTPVDETAERSTGRRTALRAPVLGTAAYNAMTSRAGLRAWVGGQQCYGAPPEDYLDYLWTAAHQPGARYAPASYLGGHLDPGVDLEEALEDVEAPTTLVWGREATSPSLTEGRELAQATDSRLVVVDLAKRLPHLEHPRETMVALDEALTPTAV